MGLLKLLINSKNGVIWKKLVVKNLKIFKLYRIKWIRIGFTKMKIKNYLMKNLLNCEIFYLINLINGHL